VQAEATENQTNPEANSEASEKFNPNTTVGTLIVALVLCLVCSMVVSVAAVSLRPLQKLNQENKKKRNVLAAAGLWTDDTTDADIPKLFESIDVQLVNLPGEGVKAGAANEDLGDPLTYDQRAISKDPKQRVTIDREKDIAGIKYREPASVVYLINNEAGELETIVLPINGKGLWSTLYGYLALAADGQTVKGITFYEHKETPGLGGEVDNPKWKAKWPGQIAVGDDGEVILEVTKPGAATEKNQIDGMSGATITSKGVENTIAYWLGDDAFGPFLDRVRVAEESEQENAEEASSPEN